MSRTISFGRFGAAGVGIFILVFFCSAAVGQSTMSYSSLKQFEEEKFAKSEMLHVEKMQVHLQLPQALTKSIASFSSQVVESQNGLTTIMTEGFEGAFPSEGWMDDGGNYTWAKRNCRSHTGGFSGWAIGGGGLGGSLACGANYPNNISNIVIYGPFDLSDANWAGLSFWISHNLQSSDYFSYMASIDGSNFYGYGLSGTSSDTWVPYTMPLNAVPISATELEDYTGNPEVWIAFGFNSDASGTSSNGVFVDDVALQKGMFNTPTVVSSFSSPGPSPRGLAYDGSSLWCSDATNDRIYKLSTAGSTLSSFSSPNTSPTGLAWDGTNLWNGDFGADRIYKLSAAGAVLSSFSAPGASAAGLTWDGSSLWYCDVDAPTIWKLNTSGAVLTSFSAPGTFHYGLAWDGQNLYLADAEALLIYKMNTDGAVLDYFLTPGTGPTGLSWDGGYLWLSDRNDDKIYKLQVQTQQVTNDVGVTDINVPSSVKPGDSVPISVTVKNFGTASQSNFPVSYSINNGQPITENFTGSLAAGASGSKTFSASWTPTTEGTYRFNSWTDLAGDENQANNALPTPKDVIVSTSTTVTLLDETFESYPTGVLADAPGTPWVRYSASRNGNVTNDWVHGGQKNFMLNSFTTSTEIDYVKLNFTTKPEVLKVELWYTPDGFFVYKDFAEVGLGYSTSRFNLDQKAGFAGSDHNVIFNADGLSSPVTVFNELEYGSGPAPSGTPKHNYMRAEFDFTNGQVKFYIGTDANAPLRSTVSFDGSLEVNALYIAGGLNPTFIDDIRVTTAQTQRFANDVGVTAMDLPDVVTVGNPVSVKALVKNYGTAAQSNFPVKYSINNGPAVTENFTGSLSAGSTATKTFSIPWTPTTIGTYQVTAWTALSSDENSANDVAPTPKDVVVESSNHSPVLSGIGNQAITAGQLKNVQLTATDSDGDPLTFNIATNPGFLSISGFSQIGNTATATLVISPGLQISGSFNANVQASDGKGGIDNENFTIQVNAPQANPLNAYRVEPLPKAIELLTGATTQIIGPNTWGELSEAISLPFSFTYAGVSYNQVKVSSAGFLTFDVTETYYYSYNDLSEATPKNAIAPLWDYLNISSGKVHYQTLGSAPNRKFIVEFYHVVWGPFSSPEVDFQILLIEGSNDIEFHYGTMADAGFGADGASIGIKDDKGNFINALDGSRDVAQNEIMTAPKMNYRFTTSPAPAKDIGVAGILVAKNWFLGTPDTVKVILENHGSEQQTGFTVAYQPEGKNPVRDVYASSLLPGTKALMSFTTTWNPDASGIYSVKAWTELAGDANTLNDSTLADDAITVYELERPRPINVLCTTDEQHRPALSWNRGHFTKPLPGVWNGKTSENQNVHMIVSFSSTHVDSCEIYYMIQGYPFSIPLKAYQRVQITNNQFSIYYSDQYGRMNTDVEGTFLPPDSCYGTWKGGVYVNNVYKVFSGTWIASAEFDVPQLLSHQIYRSLQPGVLAEPANLLTDLNNPLTTSYIDNQVAAGNRYYYCVTATYDCGRSSSSAEVSALVTGVDDQMTALPTVYSLHPAYPNPFNPQTAIHYDLPKPCEVKLRVYNVLGELVTTLVNKQQEAGRYDVIFAADGFSSGVYYIELSAGSFRSIKRVTLLK